MPFTDPIVLNPATNAHQATAILPGELYQGIQYFPAGLYAISCISSTSVSVAFYSGVTLIGTATTSAGTVNLTLSADCDSVDFVTNTGSNVAVTFTLIGLPISPVKDLGLNKFVVTGGTLTTDATYCYRAFLANGTMTISGLGSLICDVLVVAGGGSGGNANNPVNTAGGGGAGGILALAAQSLVVGSYPVTIGVGALGAVQGLQGGNSQFGSLTAAIGGGSGGNYIGGGAINGGNGGSGGGGSSFNGTGGTGSQGFNGGANTGNRTGGGGGGAGAVGQNAPIQPNGGNGGAGTNSVTGWGSLAAALAATGLGVGGYLAGGGGGGNATYYGVPTGGVGGSGGGGAAPTANAGGTGGGGVANTGGGGAAGSGDSTAVNAFNGGNGGSGLVIVRYLKTAV